MIEWIDIKQRQPKHYEIVLAKSDKGYCVVVFVDSKKMNEFLKKTSQVNECVDVKKNPFYFCSQEVQGNTLPGVTHWASLE